ncbi:PP2C family protein-serine/threonine phosphatase [Microbacterium sp. P02]|uniref:PP2C family protein-serine/threonine phosphatase n=1 Tax=unclassified Microbacterium TaxID=2609290 RepID=UPI00366C26AE
MRLLAAAVSDVGLHRSVNQDAAFTAPWGAVVADGVGGGPAGDLASSSLLHRLAATGAYRRDDPEGLQERILVANWELSAHAARDPSLVGMATTLTGIFCGATANTLLLAHTGDSRGYRLRRGVLTRMTRDDSYVQELVDQGILSLADAASHPRRNIITASLSGDEDDVVRVTRHEAEDGDRWLLCSDGVTDYVPEPYLEQLLVSVADPHDAADAVVRLALRAGTMDNVTAVVCDTTTDALDYAPSAPAFTGAAASWFVDDFDLDVETA